MDRREIGEQLNDLHFDMDEEIDARNERRGSRQFTMSHAHQTMAVSHAIVLGAIIVVAGLWGGKLLYDYVQEQRARAAINDAMRYAQHVFREAEQDSKRAQTEWNQRMAAEARLTEQLRQEELARAKTELARKAQEEKYQSAQCKFWWQQDEQKPTERTAAKKAEACGANVKQEPTFKMSKHQ